MEWSESLGYRTDGRFEKGECKGGASAEIGRVRNIIQEKVESVVWSLDCEWRDRSREKSRVWEQIKCSAVLRMETDRERNAQCEQVKNRS